LKETANFEIFTEFSAISGLTKNLNCFAPRKKRQIVENFAKKRRRKR
jgi:hypothetical protein